MGRLLLFTVKKISNKKKNFQFFSFFFLFPKSFVSCGADPKEEKLSTFAKDIFSKNKHLSKQELFSLLEDKEKCFEYVVYLLACSVNANPSNFSFLHSICTKKDLTVQKINGALFSRNNHYSYKRRKNKFSTDGSTFTNTTKEIKKLIFRCKCLKNVEETEEGLDVQTSMRRNFIRKRNNEAYDEYNYPGRLHVNDFVIPGDNVEANNNLGQINLRPKYDNTFNNQTQPKTLENTNTNQHFGPTKNTNTISPFGNKQWASQFPKASDLSKNSNDKTLFSPTRDRNRDRDNNSLFSRNRNRDYVSISSTNRDRNRNDSLFPSTNRATNNNSLFNNNNDSFFTPNTIKNNDSLRFSNNTSKPGSLFPSTNANNNNSIFPPNIKNTNFTTNDNNSNNSLFTTNNNNDSFLNPTITFPNQNKHVNEFPRKRDQPFYMENNNDDEGKRERNKKPKTEEESTSELILQFLRKFDSKLDVIEKMLEEKKKNNSEEKK